MTGETCADDACVASEAGDAPDSRADEERFDQTEKDLRLFPEGHVPGLGNGRKSGVRQEGHQLFGHQGWEKIVGPVKSFRFHDSPLRCFARVDAATAPLEAVSAETGKMLLPALRLPELYFSSVTRF